MEDDVTGVNVGTTGIGIGIVNVTKRALHDGKRFTHVEHIGVYGVRVRRINGEDTQDFVWIGLIVESDRTWCWCWRRSVGRLRRRRWSRRGRGCGRGCVGRGWCGRLTWPERGRSVINVGR